MRCIAIVLLATAACYSPSYRDCDVTCASGLCPSGLVCDQGLCHAPGASCSSGGSDDAAVDTMDDAPGIDAATSYKCFGIAGGTTNTGTAQSQSGVTNGCAPAFTFIDRINLCTCTAGFPELYVLSTMTGKANLVFVGPAPPTGTSVAANVNGTCYGSVPVCTTGTNECPAAANPTVSGWTSISVTTGSNMIRIFDDDGSGCAVLRYSFTVTLP